MCEVPIGWIVDLSRWLNGAAGAHEMRTSDRGGGGWRSEREGPKLSMDVAASSRSSSRRGFIETLLGSPQTLLRCSA